MTRQDSSGMSRSEGEKPASAGKDPENHSESRGEGKRVAAMQPYFFPYLGYFQLMKSVDTFVILDDVHFINRGWINRNRILLQGAPHLITIPLIGASQNRLINEIEIVADERWKKKMSSQVVSAYRKAPFGEQAISLFESILGNSDRGLNAFLGNSLRSLAAFLDIKALVKNSGESHPKGELSGQDRIISICLQEKARLYVNPPGGRMLYDPAEFRDVGLKLRFIQPELKAYQQLSKEDEFVGGLSILDVIAWNGREETISRLDDYQLEGPE